MYANPDHARHKRASQSRRRLREDQEADEITIRTEVVRIIAAALGWAPRGPCE